MEGEQNGPATGIENVLETTDVFFPNDDEARLLTGEKDLRRAARALQKLARIVVVKRGADGVLVVSSDGEFALPAKRTKVVETTGAGDSLNAGFLTEFAKGASLDECARAGLAAAARSVTKPGGTAAFE